MPDKERPRTPPLVGLGLLLLVTAAIYAPVLAAGFAWDDEALVQASYIPLGPEVFLTDFWSGLGDETRSSGYYRPLVLLGLALDRALFGGAAWGFHLHSLLWHLAAVAALALLLSAVTRPWAALLGATLFALHPAQSEAVCWIVARSEPMAAAFAFAGLWALAPDRPGRLHLAGGALGLLAALLCKETAAAALLLLPGLDLARWGRPRAWPRYAALGAVLGAYTLLRLVAGVGGDLPDADVGSLAPRLGSLGAHYVGRLLWPWPLTVGTHLSYLSVPSWAVVVGWLGGAAATTLLLWRGRRLAAGGLGFALVAFAPALVAVAAYGQVGERYLYLPLAGLGLAVAAAAPRPSRLLAVGVAVVAVGWLLVIGVHTPRWRDSETLWRAAVAAEPNGYATYNLANLLHRQRQVDEALDLYRQSLEATPPYMGACEDSVRLAFDTGRGKTIVEHVDLAWSRGCEPTPRAGGIRAVGLFLQGRNHDAHSQARRAADDPAGRAALVLAAVAFIERDRDTVDHVAAQYEAQGILKADFHGMLDTLLQAAGHDLPPSIVRVPVVGEPAGEP